MVSSRLHLPSCCVRDFLRQQQANRPRPGEWLRLGVCAVLLPLSAGFADASLSPLNPTSAERFGGTLSASPGRLLAGACKDNDSGTSSGSAYLYDEQSDGTWTLTAKLLAADGAAYDEFGCAVSVDGDRVVVGASKDDDNG
ncbi:MAG: hypothetical protein GX595_08930, partial [Lentisphaerae bacterium]|nr:hypothetical protein [Lentisphaerota bacterium]